MKMVNPGLKGLNSAVQELKIDINALVAQDVNVAVKLSVRLDIKK